LNPSKQSDLLKALEPVVDRLTKQVFDYGNTGVAKRAIFYKRLLPLLDWGREREGIDLSKLELTHYALRYKTTAKASLAVGGRSNALATDG
jgi:type I restriction enzyme R subunit